MKIIVDIDGTIADNSHRKHLVDGSQKKDWDRFYDLCFADAGHWDIIDLVRILIWDASTDYDPLYVTGRVERTRAMTMEWLARHNLPPGELRMRADGDHRADYVVKAELTAELTVEDVWMVLDDRDQVVKMWRDRGFRCLQVSNGDF